MLSIKQLSIALQYARLKNISKETGVSVYYLKHLRDENGDIPYSQLKIVSDYFEGESDED